MKKNDYKKWISDIKSCKSRENIQDLESLVNTLLTRVIILENVKAKEKLETLGDFFVAIHENPHAVVDANNNCITFINEREDTSNTYMSKLASVFHIKSWYKIIMENDA